LESLTRDEAEILLDTMIAGDGTIDAGGKVSFCSGSHEGASMFQVLCTLCGVAASLHERDMSKYSPRSELMPNVPRMGTIYVVNLLRRDKVQVLREHRKDFHAKQPIWCPIVPNTFFVARREGQVFITGNTPVQGTGADALKTALRLVQKRIDKTFGISAPGQCDGPVFIAHHVHDEIILETDKSAEMVKVAGKELHDGMYEGMSQFLHRVPTVVEPSSGDTWGSAK
jgi:hypothetical protein